MRLGIALGVAGLAGVALLIVVFILAIWVRRLRARRDAQTAHPVVDHSSDVEQTKAQVRSTEHIPLRSDFDDEIPADLGPKTRKLSQLLSQLEQLFLAIDRPGDAQKMRQANFEIRKSDYHGVKRVIWAFNGYGRMYGVLGDDMDNEQLEALLDEAYSLANAIKSEQ